MNASTTMILGGGFGGISTANTLRHLLPGEHQIILIDKSPTFLVGATKTWVMLGQRSPEEFARDRSGLSQRGVQVLQDEVVRIEPASGLVEASQGSFRPDFIVIALGANLNMAAIPGLDRAAHTFYTLEGAARLRQVLEDFDGGEVVLLIPRAPFKCPPAPYEAAMLLRDAFAARGLGEKTRLSIYTIEGTPMATAGPEMGQLIVNELDRRGIGFHPKMKTLGVDPASQTVSFEDGSQAEFDLLIAIPPHEAPQVVRQAGLVNQSGWIPVDANTFQIVGISGRVPLYAIGDIASVPLPGRYVPDAPLVLPKAGVFAEAQGRVVAHHISSQVLVEAKVEQFEGTGVCYIETGNQQAIKAEGHFFAMPHPVMQGDSEKEEYYREKLHWVEDWLTTNL